MHVGEADAWGGGGIRGECGLRIFHRYRHPELFVPVLSNADLRLAGPDKAGDVLCVDGGWNQFVAGGDAVNGGKEVVDAVQAGKDGARGILDYLNS